MIVKIGDIAKLLNVSTQCIRNWSEGGKIKFHTNTAGTRYYDTEDLHFEKPARERQENRRKEIFYCRVSSRKQEEDLERQISKAREIYPEIEIVKDIASGLNWKRKGLRSIIKKIVEGKISRIYVFHKDRLCRFGFEILEYIFKLHNVELMVLDKKEHKSREQEMSEDVLEIMHVFSCSLYGKRRNSSIQTKDKIQIFETTESNPEGEAEDDSNGTLEDDGIISDGI